MLVVLLCQPNTGLRVAVANSQYVQYGDEPKI